MIMFKFDPGGSLEVTIGAVQGIIRVIESRVNACRISDALSDSGS